ncbi:MAG: cellulase family glycosylhydrolase [Acutalibacteraceae bacterium]|nr:cellulase family glycosylhydrolase [Acutalibacteraceae bacterium]
MFGKKFAFGVNYWASENATRMWRDFDAVAIERDFVALKNAGVKWLRIFPTWDDFQPIRELTTWGGKHFEVVYNDETPLDDSPEGKAGVSAVMFQRLQKVMDLCFKYGFKVDLAIFTGFMSSMNYIPRLLEHRNIFTDPVALMWEQKYIKYMVTRFKDHSALGGWDLGNECSVMRGINGDVAAQYSWSMMVSNAIRVIDKEHPVISGQDGFGNDTLTPENAEGWQLLPHAECVDILTTHPYPIFREASDKINTMRPIVHTSAENSMFEDIAGKMCFIEETGSIGYQTCSLESEADFIRGDLLSSYLHGCHGYFWWCAFDQGVMDFAPYDWNNIGSDYGLLHSDRAEKPVSKEAKRVMTIISQLDLPKYERQAVCVIPRNISNATSLATAVMCLSEQNDVGVKYCGANQNLPDSKLYIVPRIEGNGALRRSCVEGLKEKARNGATVYISMGGGFLRMFPELLGIEIISREAPGKSLTVNIDGEELPVSPNYIYHTKNIDGKVLANFSDGTPAIVSHPFGRGRIIISLFSPEAQATWLKGAFDREGVPQYSLVYSLIFKAAGIKPDFFTDNIYVCAKEHKIDSKRSIISLMNYNDNTEEYTVSSTVGYQVKKTYYGSLDGKLQKNDAVIFEIEKY